MCASVKKKKERKGQENKPLALLESSARVALVALPCLRSWTLVTLDDCSLLIPISSSIGGQSCSQQVTADSEISF